MADYRLSLFAGAQLDEILAESEDAFGVAARERYAVLLVAAMQDVAEHPDRAGVRWRRQLRQRVAIYHVKHSRRRVPDPPGRVGQPRHFLVFRVAANGVADILGFVHERMLRRRALRKIVEAADADEE